MLAQLLPFLGVSAAVICTPGPDTALTVRNALAGGRRGGVWTAAGVALGQLVWTVAVAMGVAGLLLASTLAVQVVKLLGAAYLVWLGAQALLAARRGAGAPPDDLPDGPPAGHLGALPAGRALRQGLLSNLANPKMAAFFLSLLPQFLPGSGGAGWLLVLGAVFCSMTFLWLAGYGLAVHRARRLLRGPARRVVNAVSGTVLVAFGLLLAFDDTAARS